MILALNPIQWGRHWIWAMLFVQRLAADSNRVARFKSLVLRHSDLLTRICYFYANSADEFKDMRQDVLINIWRGLDSYRGESMESTWIYRICLNTCISSLRQSLRIRKSVPLSVIFESHVYDSVEKDERIDRLHELIQNLNAQDRSIIMMWLDEKTYEDIAEVMGVCRNTVASRLRRIKEKLIQLNTKYND